MINKSIEIAPEVRKKLEQLRILVIDDNAIDRQMIKVHLEALGVTQVQDAKNGNEGLFKITNLARMGSHFNIILTDWKMPHMDGLTVLKTIRSQKFSKRLSVIMLTSVSEEPNVKSALQAGINDYILKPIDPLILSKKITNQIEINGKLWNLQE
jgi:two-component system chemotaxis response regulator CheY